MDIKTLKSKASELRALFVLAQRVVPFVEELFLFSEKAGDQFQLFVPFMEELFVFIEETAPLLDEVNNAIKDNLKKMPNASKQLSKVTQATEMASTEIMDTVDRVNDELYKVVKELEEYRNNQKQLFENPITLLKMLADAIANGKDLSPYLSDIQQFIDRENDIRNNEHLAIITNIIEKVQHISDDANTIINSLQVQDITAQQLAAVNNLIESIQTRLLGIMKKLNTEELAALRNATSTKPKADNEFDGIIRTSTLHRNIAFDPDAVDSLTAEHRQEDIDAMFANADLTIAELTDNIIKTVDNGETDNIDDLINSFNNNTTENVEQNNEVNNEEIVVEDFSQDDLDAMFNNS